MIVETNSELFTQGKLIGYSLLNMGGIVQIDVWKDSYVNFPPTDADTITGGNEIISHIDNCNKGVC